MANSDKINSSSSLNHAPSSFNETNMTDLNIDDVVRQFDSLNLYPTTAPVGTKISTNNRNSKCDFSCR